MRADQDEPSKALIRAIRTIRTIRENPRSQVWLFKTNPKIWNADKSG
jgi:hypothetical protein